MKVYREIGIEDFEGWSGARATIERIIDEGKEDEFNDLIEESYPDGISETELNDILWFDDEWVYEMLGISTDEEE